MTNHNENMDPALSPIATQIDALAQADAAAARPGLESRIAAASAPMLKAPAAEIPPTYKLQVRASLTAHTNWSVRLAAAVALMAAAGAAWLAQRPAVPTSSTSTARATTEADDSLLALAWGDNENTDLIAIRTAADSLGESIRSNWTAGDLLTDDGATQ